MASAQQPKPQTVFDASNPVYKLQLDGKITTEPPHPTVDHPVAIPARVLELLREDALFKELVGSMRDSGPELLDDWYVASEIDLGCTRGLLIVGQGPLRGNSRTAPFWIFAADDTGAYRPPLAVVAERLEIRGRGKSCREVMTTAATRGYKLLKTTYRLKDGEFVRHKVKRTALGEPYREWPPGCQRVDRTPC